MTNPRFILIRASRSRSDLAFPTSMSATRSLTSAGWVLKFRVFLIASAVADISSFSVVSSLNRNGVELT